MPIAPPNRHKLQNSLLCVGGDSVRQPQPRYGSKRLLRARGPELAFARTTTTTTNIIKFWLQLFFDPRPSPPHESCDYHLYSQLRYVIFPRARK